MSTENALFSGRTPPQHTHTHSLTDCQHTQKHTLFHQDQANSFKAQLAQQKQAVDQLISNTRILETKLAEAKTKKDTLKARAASAKTSKQINEMLGNVSTGRTALEAFDKMEEKVMAMEAESEAAFAVR